MTPAEKVLCRVHIWGRGLRADVDAIEPSIVADARRCLVASGVLIEIESKKAATDYACANCRNKACGGTCKEVSLWGRRVKK